jgi:lipopolysaccharide export system protein LptA
MKPMQYLRLILLLALFASHSLYGATDVGQTMIESQSLEMKGEETENRFFFHQNVRVANKNLLLTCDELLVTSERRDGKQAVVGQVGAILSIIAEGNVVIRQGGRVAYAGKAEVDPRNGLVVLTRSPRIVDQQAEVRGWKIILNKETKVAQVLPDPNTRNGKEGRSTVILGGESIPDLSYDQLKDETPKTPPAPTQAPIRQPEPITH